MLVRKHASLRGAGVHRKSAVCNFCSPRTDCTSTAVAETAVLKTVEGDKVHEEKGSSYDTKVNALRETNKIENELWHLSRM